MYHVLTPAYVSECFVIVCAQGSLEEIYQIISVLKLWCSLWGKFRYTGHLVILWIPTKLGKRSCICLCTTACLCECQFFFLCTLGLLCMCVRACMPVPLIVCVSCVCVRVCCMYIPVCRCSFVCLYVAALLYMYRHLISWLFLFVFIGYMAHHTLYTEA